MKSYTRDDIFEMVEEEDVGFIRLQFTDIFGTFKNVAVTASQLKRALDNQCMFDGSSIRGLPGGGFGHVPVSGSEYVCNVSVETAAGKSGPPDL